MLQFDNFKFQNQFKHNTNENTSIYNKLMDEFYNKNWIVKEIIIQLT